MSKALLSLPLMCTVLAGAQTYQPNWESFTLKEYPGAKPKAVTLLGSTARLRVKSAAGKITVELPELPEELLAQPAWELKFSH